MKGTLNYTRIYPKIIGKYVDNKQNELVQRHDHLRSTLLFYLKKEGNTERKKKKYRPYFQRVAEGKSLLEILNISKISLLIIL